MAKLLFPPIVKNSLSPLVYKKDDKGKITLNGKGNFCIEFENPANNIEYTHIRARIILQNTNKSIVNTAIWQDSFIYRLASEVEKDNKFRINVSGINNFPIDSILKIQLSYVYNEKYKDICPYQYPVTKPEVKYSDWLKELKEGDVSEWSAVIATKFITIKTEPTVYLNDTLGLNPTFWGKFSLGNEVSKETQSKHKFDLRQGSKEGTLLESSGWITTNASDQKDESYRFKTQLEDFGVYNIEYTIQTSNGYQASGYLDHTAYENIIDEKNVSSIECIPNYEEGSVAIYFTWDSEKAIQLESNEIENGIYVISRASEKDNYSKWDDVYTITLENFSGTTLLYTDYTIESGISYKYAVQKEFLDNTYPMGMRSARIYQQERNEYGQLVEAPPICIYLQYSYLFYDGIQLKLKYNNKISSYKNTVIASKQDTLGSRYPTILRNGMAYYAEFPLSGLISIHMDEEGQTFFKPKLYDHTGLGGELGLYYKDELVIPLGKLELATYPINTNLTGENIYVERIFREKVEEFLNDGTPKLFRSPTEGNHIISLMNVSMTPNQQLGRMISEFSSNAYEIMDCTLENMFEYGILSSSSTSNLVDKEVYLRGRVQLFAEEDLEEIIMKGISSKYEYNGSKIIQLDIEMGGNITGQVNLTVDNNSTVPIYIVNYYNAEANNLNVSHELEFPIYVGYTIKTKYGEFYWRNDLMRGKKKVSKDGGVLTQKEEDKLPTYSEITAESAAGNKNVFFLITEEIEKNGIFWVQKRTSKQVKYLPKIYSMPNPDSDTKPLWERKTPIISQQQYHLFTFSTNDSPAFKKALKAGNYFVLTPYEESEFITSDFKFWTKGDAISQMEAILTLRSSTKKQKTILRLLALKFEGEGTVWIGNDPHGDDKKKLRISKLGLTISPAQEIRYIELEEGETICRFYALTMEDK